MVPKDTLWVCMNMALPSLFTVDFIPKWRLGDIDYGDILGGNAVISTLGLLGHLQLKSKETYDCANMISRI